MSLELLTYFSISYKSNWRDTLLVITVISRGSEQMKFTRTSDFVFLRDLLILVICSKEFFIKLEMITCFLKRPFVII